MKRLLPVFLLLALAWFACNKSVVAPDVKKGTITATINGVDETFNMSDSVLYLAKQPQTADWVFKASGHNSADAVTDRIWFIIDYQAPIVAGAEYNNEVADKPINVEMSYIKPGKQYIASYPDPVSVTITSFSSTSVQGAFSGTMHNNGETSTITNGKFNLYFAKPVVVNP
jgi:hypothetical protein